MTHADATDAELLAAHVAGDTEAFGVLFGRHRDRLWAVALRTTGNPEEAADGLQDGMVAAFRRAASYRGEAAVTTWLHRVVVNACLDRLRAARVRRTEPLPDDVEEHADRGVLVADRLPDPAEVALTTEQREIVLAALGRLPLEQRAALVLVDMEGYSVSEAAEVLGCAEGTVKSRCSRGRARLAVLLGVARDTPPAGNPTGPHGVPSRHAHPPGATTGPAGDPSPGPEEVHP